MDGKKTNFWRWVEKFRTDGLSLNSDAIINLYHCFNPCLLNPFAKLLLRNHCNMSDSRQQEFNFGIKCIGSKNPEAETIY